MEGIGASTTSCRSSSTSARLTTPNIGVPLRSLATKTYKKAASPVVTKVPPINAHSAHGTKPAELTSSPDRSHSIPKSPPEDEPADHPAAHSPHRFPAYPSSQTHLKNTKFIRANSWRRTKINSPPLVVWSTRVVAVRFRGVLAIRPRGATRAPQSHRPFDVFPVSHGGFVVKVIPEHRHGDDGIDW